MFEILVGLFEDRSRILLDAGCGPGKITLGLIDHLDRADAVDPSAEIASRRTFSAKRRQSKDPMDSIDDGRRRARDSVWARGRRDEDPLDGFAEMEKDYHSGTPIRYP